MSLIRTQRGTTGLTSVGANHVTTGSFTPAANSFLVVKVGYLQDFATSGAPVIVVSGGSLTYTEQVHGTHGLNEDFNCHARIFTAPVGASPSSMTVDVSWSGGGLVTNDGGSPDRIVIGVEVEEWTGQDQTTPVGLVAGHGTTSGTGHSGTEHLSLGGSTGARSRVTGALISDGSSAAHDDATNPITPDTGFTSGFHLSGDNSGSGSNWWTVQDIYQTAAGSVSTCDWAAWTRSNGFASAAIEIKAGGPARTDQTSNAFPNVQSSYVSSSFTPPANSLLVVTTTMFQNATNIGAGLAISDSVGLTWTSQLSQDHANGSRSPIDVWQQTWTAPVGGSPTSMQVTITPPATSGSFGGCVIHVVAYTGYDTGSPIGAKGQAASSTKGINDPMSCTLNATPAATSVVFGSLAVNPQNSGSGVTQGVGCTEIYDTINDPDLQSQDRVGSTSTSVDWADVDTGDSTGGRYACGAQAIEIKLAGSGDTLFIGNNLRFM